MCRSDDRTRTVNAKVRFFMCSVVTTDIFMHAADERAGAVQMLRMKSMA